PSQCRLGELIDWVLDGRMPSEATMLFLFFAAALCLATLVVPRAALALPPQERWNRVRTTNFVLVGNYSPSGLREIAIRLERFRTVLQSGRETESELASQPTTIVVFKDEFAFAPYKIQKNGQPSRFQGFFMAGLDCNYFGLGGGPNRD